MNLRFLGWINNVWMRRTLKGRKRYSGKFRNSAMEVFNLEAHETPR